MRAFDFAPPKRAFARRPDAVLVLQRFAGLVLIAGSSSLLLTDIESRAAVLGPKQLEASVQQCLGSFLRRNPRVAVATSKVVEVRLLKRGESGSGTALKMANAYSYNLPAATADLSAINIDIIWKPRRTQALSRSARFGCNMSEDGRVLSVHSLATPSL